MQKRVRKGTGTVAKEEKTVSSSGIMLQNENRVRSQRPKF